MQDDQVDYKLLVSFIEGNTSPEQTEKILVWINASKGNEELYIRIKDVVDYYRATESMDKNIAGQWQKVVSLTSTEKEISFFNWKKLSIAASVLLVITTSIFFFNNHLSDRDSTKLKVAQSSGNDIAPAGDKAILTLADGSTIVLDNTKNGILAEQANMKVQQSDGQIIYNRDEGSETSTGNQTLYNTLSTSKGNQYSLVLADGSTVWLNALSSIRFPTSFNGKERKVEISGEAYFEVAKNPSKPFRVVANGSEVEVLGTHFNINAYADEPGVKTTLVEGLVKVRKDKAVQMLSPGQQAVIEPGGEIKLSRNADITEILAWKDGYFLFNNTNLHQLMREIARWYDVDISVEGNVDDDGFSGKIPRNVMLSKLLRILELNDVNFRMEGKKLIVSP